MLHSTTPTAEEITRASKSNLALGLVLLPRERRRDMHVFYAFCRVVDDIADDDDRPAEERRAALNRWRESLTAEISDQPPLAPEVRALIAKYRLDPALLGEIITGCEMDLDGAAYETWDDLRLYCHRVASVVGLVSIEIFGYRDPACREYALNLGLALQITNILRDVGEDFARDGRVYLPREDMRRFGYDVEDLRAHRHDSRFTDLMQFEAERAIGYYKNAAAALPRCDRRAMVAAELMRAIYRRLLDKMQCAGFRVFGRRYSLSRVEKLALIGRVFATSALAR